MTSNILTTKEALLLQRYLDGEASKQERPLAEALLENRASARVYRELLKELRTGVEAAHQEALDRANFEEVDVLFERAANWAGYAEESLEELAPLLERFHDGEADLVEATLVGALIDERDDVAAYLAELEGISLGIQEITAGQEVDFGNLWSTIESSIAGAADEVDAPIHLDPYRPAEHGLLVQRFFDGEVTSDERRRVQNWIDGEVSEVVELLAAMEELHLSTNVAIDWAQEDAPLDEIWSGIEARLGQIDAEQAAPNVVSLDSRQGARRPSWQFAMAAAAMVLLSIAVGLLAQQALSSPERIIETRTVVIFDSVENAPGSSVMIHSPELASHESGEDDLPILWVIEDEEEDWDDEEVESDDRFQGPF